MMPGNFKDRIVQEFLFTVGEFLKGLFEVITGVILEFLMGLIAGLLRL